MLRCENNDQLLLNTPLRVHASSGCMGFGWHGSAKNIVAKLSNNKTRIVTMPSWWGGVPLLAETQKVNSQLLLNTPLLVHTSRAGLG